MLAEDHADRRQLTDLVATEPPLGLALGPGELATAVTELSSMSRICVEGEDASRLERIASARR
jgi:hypothetical protein